jgi:hypothetical protein
MQKQASSGTLSKYTPIDRLNIPGFQDDAVKEYCPWQQPQVKELALKAAYQTACGVIVILEEGMEPGTDSPESKP